MLPSQLIEVAALPLTPSGKLDRAALPTPLPLVATAITDLGKASPVEQTIADIWADVLGVPVGLDDDFFDLGGHSLLAVGLMSRIESVFDKRIALATLFEARTVRQLAEIVQERKAPSAWVSLVPVQTLGSKPPFFCVHGVGGEVLAYSALASHLKPDQPFIAFRASGYSGVMGPLQTIEEQASLYIREMIAYQPEGPYYIGGYSTGGSVALEMAIQLEAMHKEVAFLGILDATPFQVRQRSLTYVGRWLRNVPLWFKYDGRKTPWRSNLWRLGRIRQVTVRRLFRHASWPGRATGPRHQRDIGDMMNVDRLPEHVRRLYQLDFEAFLAYRPRTRCASATLFRSRGQPLFGSHEPDLGWSRVTRDGVDVRQIPGNHSSIMAEPDVRHLASALRLALEEAQMRASRTLEQKRGVAVHASAEATLARPVAHRPVLATLT